MDYLSVAAARNLPGLRLVLTSHAPGPWSEAAKAMFRIRGVPFVPVEQISFAPNEDLVAWTGMRNAPIAMYEKEGPRSGWLEIALLAERLGNGPSLFPSDPRQRAMALGFTTEIAGEDGLGWARRLLIFSFLWGDGKLSDDAPPGAQMMRTAYRHTPQTAAAAQARVIMILNGLTAQLRDQQAAGSPYLVGDTLSLCDIYWATFSAMLAPLSHENSPMAEHLRTIYSTVPPEITAALDPSLIVHRDRIFKDHIGLPMDF